MVDEQGLNPREFGGLRGLSVLIVEDSWIIASGMMALLDVMGVKVLGPASTVHEADEIVASAAVSAAIVDMNLHGEMAYDLVDRLNARKIPVVVVTGYDTLPSLAAKVEALYRKPLRSADLLKSLRTIAVGWMRGTGTPI